MTCVHPRINVRAKTCWMLTASSVFRPLLQMADCGGMPQVDQVCTTSGAGVFFGALFMLSSRQDNQRWGSSGRLDGIRSLGLRALASGGYEPQSSGYNGPHPPILPPYTAPAHRSCQISDREQQASGPESVTVWCSVSVMTNGSSLFSAARQTHRSFQVLHSGDGLQWVHARCSFGLAHFSGCVSPSSGGVNNSKWSLLSLTLLKLYCRAIV